VKSHPLERALAHYFMTACLVVVSHLAIYQLPECNVSRSLRFRDNTQTWHVATVGSQPSIERVLMQVRRSPDMPTFTMRLPDRDYEALQAMALLTGRSMAELVRDAVADSLTNFAKSDDLHERYEAERRAREHARDLLRQRLEAPTSEDPDNPSQLPDKRRERVPAAR
jgi:hypothetical protein